jgi:hypothetical protein
MSRYLQLFIRAISINQILMGLLILGNYAQHFFQLDCENIDPYSVSGSITIVDNCYLNFLIVLHAFILIGLIAIISGILLWRKKTAGWVGSFFSALVFSGIILFSLMEDEIKLNDLFFIVFFTMMFIEFFAFYPLLQLQVRKSFSIKGKHLLFAFGMLIILMITQGLVLLQLLNEVGKDCS